MRDEINETRDQLTEKLVVLEDRIREQVETVKTRADETIENVKGTVRALSPRYQIREHPLTALGVAVGAGLLTGAIRGRRRHGVKSADAASVSTETLPTVVRPVEEKPLGPSALSRLANYFDDELQLVKGMAVAGIADGLASFVRSKQSAFAPQVDELARSVRRKVGRDGDRL